MNKRVNLLCSALIAALFCLPAIAQPGPGMGMGGMRGPGPGPNCVAMNGSPPCGASQEARAQARDACRDLRGPARRDCMQKKMPPPDCSKAPFPANCDAHQKARALCKDKFGPEHRSCVIEQFNIR